MALVTSLGRDSAAGALDRRGWFNDRAADLESHVRARPDRTVLLLDGDALSRHRLGRALAIRGFEPTLADTVGGAVAAIETATPAFAVIETRLADGSGLAVLKALKAAGADTRVVVLTEQSSIASAVAAMKAGADDYLAKPADAEVVACALLGEPPVKTLSQAYRPMSVARIRWEHIQMVYELCGHNVSETARRLKMHRRTLQRILQKRAPQ
jgi:two-component system response regulator RegA